MAPPALAAAAAGADVDGCDIAPPRGPDVLTDAGIRVAHGHDGAHVDGRHLVVTTIASPDLPEVTAAAAAGRLHHRTDLLAAVVRGRPTIAVTGTHGKGTVAALVGSALQQLGADPLVLLGVAAPVLGGSFRGGAGPAVVEADDADGTIARIPATVSVVTNSWFDHPMLGRTRREVLDDVCVHVAAVDPGGLVVIGRGRNLAPVAAAARAPVWKLGRDFDVETVQVDDDGRRLRFRDPESGAMVSGRVSIHGGRIAENAALAYAALRSRGIEAEEAASALAALDALDRRLQLVGVARGVRVFDDYGKHPEATAASLDAVRELRPKRVHVVYEPHLHADVRRWGRQWARALGRADSCIVLPVDMRTLLAPERRAAPRWPADVGLRADLPESRAEALDLLVKRCAPGDVVVISGAHPDLATLAESLVASLSA
jgi:UDP-N-acetylmuramate--alanine ligase